MWQLSIMRDFRSVLFCVAFGFQKRTALSCTSLARASFHEHSSSALEILCVLQNKIHHWIFYHSGLGDSPLDVYSDVPSREILQFTWIDAMLDYGFFVILVLNEIQFARSLRLNKMPRLRQSGTVEVAENPQCGIDPMLPNHLPTIHLLLT